MVNFGLSGIVEEGVCTYLRYTPGQVLICVVFDAIILAAVMCLTETAGYMIDALYTVYRE